MIINTANQKIRIDAVAENIFRIRRNLCDAFEDVSLIVKPREAYTGAIETDGVQLKTPAYALRAENGAVVIKNAKGGAVYREKECTLYPTILQPDPRTIPTQLCGKIGSVIFSYDLKLDFTDDEILTGLGHHRIGCMNLRGQYVPLVQYNLYQPVPVLMSSRGYILFIDAYSIQYFDDRGGRAVWHVDASSCADYYVILGKDCDQLIRGYRSLVGSTSLFPKALFGYIQSKERYKSQQELIGVVEKYRRLQIPLDVIVQDWMYWEEEKQENWGDKSFCSRRYPDPQAMVDELHRHDAGVMISIWPKLGERAQNAAAFTGERGLLPGGYYNAYREDCREIYYRQLYDGIMKYGFDILWTDDTEPLEPEMGLTEEPSGEELVEMMRRAYSGFCDPRFSNAYVLLHNRGLYERLRRNFPSERKMMLTRASYAGINAVGTVSWTGDIRSSFDELRLQIPSMLNHSMAGEAYDHFDIGGFFPEYQPVYKRSSGDYVLKLPFQNRAYSEFYVRALELATFLPIMRSHGTRLPREIWRFGKKGGMFYNTIEKFIRLRYRLLPYLYSMNYHVAMQGKSIIYPLCAKFPDSVAARENESYLFGEELLVCPVLRHMYYRPPYGRKVLKPQTAVDVYLPAGTDWYHFETGRGFQGGQRVRIDAPLDTIPVFAKAGAILPLNQTKIQSTREHSALEVFVYPGADGAFDYYDDDGHTNAFLQGEYTFIHFEYRDAEGILTVSGKVRGNLEFSVQNMATHQTQQVHFSSKTQTLRI